MDSNATDSPNNPPPPSPPQGPPPVIIRQAPPPPPRKGRAWILWMVCSIFLAFMLLGTLISNLAGGIAAPGRPHESVVKENHSRNKVLLVEVEGMITTLRDRGGSDMVTLFKDHLDNAADDDRVKAVLLKVNSPGGEVLASDEMYRAVSKFQKESGKPVVAVMEALAASGGYYVSAPCQWIVANPLSITGSIGVIMQTYNFRELMDKVGVQPFVFKSGKFKDMLSWDKPPGEILPEEKRMIQALVDETYNRFAEVVSEGRAEARRLNGGKGRTLSEDWKRYADGRILSGKQAHELGFVDELGGIDQAFERTLLLAGIEDANLVRYEQPFSLGDLFWFLGSAEKQATIKVDLGIDLPRLQAGRLYFLPSAFFH